MSLLRSLLGLAFSAQAPRGFDAPYRGFPALLAPSYCLKNRQTTQAIGRKLMKSADFGRAEIIRQPLRYNAEGNLLRVDNMRLEIQSVSVNGF